MNFEGSKNDSGLASESGNQIHSYLPTIPKTNNHLDINHHTHTEKSGQYI
jgi:hypothetical protein